MGYVLPVQMDAYTQYANRTATSKERIKLDPVFKSTFYRVDSQYSWEEIQKSYYRSLSKIDKEKGEIITIAPHLIADITGKGRYVNESV